MPIHDIHYELFELERARRARTAFDMAVNGRAKRTPSGLRVRFGRALISGGRALAGATSDHNGNGQHPRPVSAHR